VRIFTRENGLKSFLVKGARKPNASFKAGYFLPLTLVELVYRASAGEGLNFLKECRPWPILQAIRFDPVKAQVGVFMAEVFKKVIHEHHRDDVLFDFAQANGA
jgi:DNA repair protein RecO (recombination protein O)